ncbi:MAG: protein kinase domain-containing protein [Parachlamydiaceae bacterium]
MTLALNYSRETWPEEVQNKIEETLLQNLAIKRHDKIRYKFFNCIFNGTETPFKTTKSTHQHLNEIYLLKMVYGQSQLPLLPSTQFFKKKAADGLSFFTNGQGELFALTKFYLPSRQGAKKMRAAVRIQDLVVAILYSSKKESNDSLVRDLSTRSQITHQNILSIEVISKINSNHSIKAISLFAPAGNLENFFKQQLSSADEVSIQKDCFRYFREIIKTLEALHTKGIIHRDLHPRHFLLFPSLGASKTRLIKLIDFSRACFIDLFKQSIREQCRKKIRPALEGNRRCLAPEQYLAYADIVENAQNPNEEKINHLTSPASDIWSLGCLFYYLYKGEVFSFFDTEEPADIAHPSFKYLLDRLQMMLNDQAETPFKQAMREMAQFILIVRVEDRPTLAKIKQKLERVERQFDLQISSS